MYRIRVVVLVSFDHERRMTPEGSSSFRRAQPDGGGGGLGTDSAGDRGDTYSYSAPIDKIN